MISRVLKSSWVKAMLSRALMPRKRRAAFFVFMFCFACVSAPAQRKSKEVGNGKTVVAEPAEPASAPLYVIQPNDVLEIFVWKEQELTRKAFVRPDGRISVPLVQDMPAAGLSPKELKDEIEKRLKAYIEEPNVTVIVDAIQSYKVYVTGKVQKPGPILAEKPVTVLQAIAMAGGFQDYANQSGITIVRKYPGESILFRFDYNDVAQGKKPEQDIFLRSGDVILVP